MNATPETTPPGAVTPGRVVLSEKHAAVLAAFLPFGLLILGVVAVAVLAGKRGNAAPVDPKPPAKAECGDAKPDAPGQPTPSDAAPVPGCPSN